MKEQMGSRLRRIIREHALTDGVDSLIFTERLFADAEYGDIYESAAEGYIVTYDELREAMAEMKAAERAMINIADAVRHEKNKTISDFAWQLHLTARAMAIESVHLAAAAAKLVRTIDDSEEHTNDTQTADSAGN